MTLFQSYFRHRKNAYSHLNVLKQTFTSVHLIHSNSLCKQTRVHLFEHLIIAYSFIVNGRYDNLEFIVGNECFEWNTGLKAQSCTIRTYLRQ